MAKQTSQKEPRPTGNSLGTKLQEYVERVERLDEEKKQFCDGINSDKNEIFDEAEDAGIHKKVLKDRLAKNKAARTEAERRGQMNGEELAQLQQVEQLEAIGEAFGDDGFGQATRDLAKMIRSGEVSLSVNYADGRSTEGQYQPPHTDGIDDIDDIDELASIDQHAR